MVRTKIWFSLVIFCSLLWRSCIAGTRSVRIAADLIGASPITLLEDDLYQRIEFQAESVGRDGSTVEPTDFGDVEIEYVLASGAPGEAAVEPGFDFTPDTGPLPYTFTVTIKEGESESSLFVLQILDDCIMELMNEPLRIFPVRTIVTSTMGSSYSVDQTPLLIEIDDGGSDSGSIEIHVDQEFHPDVGFVFFEGDANPVIPVKGLESCTGREVPIDDICIASIHRTTGDPIFVAGKFMITSPVQLDSDKEFSFTIDDDDVAIDVEYAVSYTDFAFAGATCQGGTTFTTHSLDTADQFRISIIDDDVQLSYGIVYPAAIGRKESRDVHVCAVTNQVNTPTDLCRNDLVAPYTTQLPLCKSTDLKCGEGAFGQCTVFPKPKRESRDRFGSYFVSAQYDTVRTFPVFVRSLSDVLTPLHGPTITINNYEDVHIGVKFSAFVRELRWYFNGKELKMFRGKCNFEIYVAKYGVHDGYYEVARVQRGNSGYRTIIRLIIRKCEYQEFTPDGETCTFISSRPSCYNGGVLTDELVDKPTCVCPLGFYGLDCLTVEPTSNFRVGPFKKKLNCRDINPDMPRDCKGALFCYRDPLGCLCARGYWGPKCDRVCPHGRFGWSCLQHCHCSGPWEACDHKTGICKTGCQPGYFGQNCQNQ